MDTGQRQDLEDALFDLNMALASQAVAQGVPLLQYVHPGARHKGTTTVPRWVVGDPDTGGRSRGSTRQLAGKLSLVFCADVISSFAGSCWRLATGQT